MNPRVVLPPSLPLASPAARAAAGLLLTASRLLDRAACRLIAAPAIPALPDPALPCVEFHADASAPEGALYVDGRLVGFVPGVSRL